MNTSTTKALIIVSFGTTHDEGRAQSLDAIEEIAARRFPDWHVCQAFTSAAVRTRLSARGITYASLKEQLDRLHRQGFSVILVMPVLLLAGIEYEKICRTMQLAQNRFKTIHIEEPLLASYDARISVLRHVCQSYRTTAADGIVCIGHGSAHAANRLYSLMQEEAQAAGLSQLHIGTIEAAPSFDDVSARILQARCSRVTLVPLLYTAGVHTAEDIAGRQEMSWRTRFEKAGIAVYAETRGLGEIPWMRELVLERCRQAVSLAESAAGGV